MCDKMEEWKNVKGYEEQYEVSNLGNVRRKTKNLKPSVSPHGYKTLSLSKNGECSSKIVHRLVAEAFLDNNNNKAQVNHKDCDKLNNHVSNLEWMTAQENISHSVSNNRQRNQNGEANNMSKLTKEDVLHIRGLIAGGMSTYKVHKEHYPNFHQQTIYAIKQRRLWKNI
jgi:hypothetical protein